MPYVQVENLEETLKRSEAAGGEALFPPTDLDDSSHIAWPKDPEGLRLGLHESGASQVVPYPVMEEGALAFYVHLQGPVPGCVSLLEGSRTGSYLSNR